MIKNMRNWMIFSISLVIFGSLSVYLPVFDVSEVLLRLTLIITSILFGLLSGFFISELWKKYSTIRKLNSRFTSNLSSILSSIKMLENNKTVKENFEDKLYTYLIVYTLLPWNNMEKGKEYFNKLSDNLEKVNLHSEQDKIIFDNLISNFESTSSIRKELTTLGQERLLGLEWMILLCLSSIMVVSSMLLRNGSIFFNLISTLLSSVVVLTLAILHDLNTLRWHAEEVSFSPVNELYEMLDKKEFYEKRFIEAGIIEPESENYITEEDLSEEHRKIYEKFKGEGLLASSSILGYEV